MQQYKKLRSFPSHNDLDAYIFSHKNKNDQRLKIQRSFGIVIFVYRLKMQWE